MQDSYDEFDEGYTAKVVLLGSEGVGKTCLAIRCITDKFADSTTPTIGASYMKKRVRIAEDTITLRLWDTAGQERFESMTSMYFRGADGAILVFDVSDKRSLQRVKHWVSVLMEHRDVREDIALVMCANKCDKLKESDPLSNELFIQAKEYCRELGAHCMLFQTSALTGTGIIPMFHSLAERLLDLKMTELSGMMDDHSEGLVLERTVKLDRRKGRSHRRTHGKRKDSSPSESSAISKCC